LIKEYVLKIESNLVEIVFSPNDGNIGFGFVNALEIFTAPLDFIVDYGARFVSSSGVQEYKNLSSEILETVHRINVGGLISLAVEEFYDKEIDTMKFGRP